MNQKSVALLFYRLFSIILLGSLLFSSFGATKVLTVQAQANEGSPASMPDSANIIWTSQLTLSPTITPPIPNKGFQPFYGADCSPSAYGYNQDSTYFSDVLGFMSIPVTQFALDAFAHWKPYENTAACWNPLATILAASSIGDSSCTDTIFNFANVRNYSSKVCGEKATAITLLYTPSGSGAFYKPIRDMLSQQSFNWQAIHDALMHWIGSDAYSTSLTNEWQTLWNSRGGGGTPPGEPTLISPINGQSFTEGQSISLSWSATGNEYYGEVWGGPAGTTFFDWQTGTSKNIGAQWAGYVYSWRVKARNNVGESNWSFAPTFVVRPGAPIGLSISAVSCSQLNLSWSDNSGSEAGYKVYRNGNLVATVSQNSTSYADSGLSQNTNYSYVVKAYRGNIESNSSNTVSATTSLCSSNPPLLSLNLGSMIRNRPVTIELRYPLLEILGSVFTWSTTTDANGNIINFPLTGANPGTTYYLLVKPQGWLRKQKQVTFVSGSNIVDFQQAFGISAGGDIDGNNKVDLLDYQVLSNEFGTTTNPRSDLNGDGITDLIDFQLLSNGFGKVGDGGEIIITGPAVIQSPANEAPGQLTLVPSSNTPQVGDVITVNLDYDTATLSMAAVDAMIDYDQCVLQPITNQIIHSGIFATTATVSTPGTLEYEGLKWTGVNPGPSVSGGGHVASIPFRVIANVPATTLGIRFRQGSTYLSNMAQDDIVHPFLGHVGNAVLYPTGAPQRVAQSAQITSPSSGEIINQNFVLLQAQVSDACNGIHQVTFSAFYDNQWHIVATDNNSGDGWAVYWDASQVSDQVLKVKAFAGDFAGNGVETAVTENIRLLRSPHDKDTAGVFRPSNGLLYLKNFNTTGFADIAINYGIGGDYAVVGDWDGDGTATIGVYRNGKFYLRNSNTVGFADWVFAFGTPGDQPVAGDWNGDSIDTIGIYRPSTGQFLLRNNNSAGPADMSFYLGNVGDVGIAGDWNGDGFDTTGVFRPSNGIVFLKNTNDTGFADIALNYGIPGDKPVTGDWDNDGIDTIGVYRNATFYLRNSNTIGFADIVFGLGNPGDMPIAGNWDGVP